MAKVRKFREILAFLAAALAAGAAFGQPLARDGLLDLRDVDFARGAIAGLDGDWRIQWGRFDEPSAMAGAAAGAGVPIRVPGAWNDVAIPGKPPGAFGYATYQLTVQCSGRTRLALALPLQASALRLYVNGRLAAVQGSPGGTPGLARAAWQQQIAPLEDVACPLDIVAHVSNYEMRQGGLVRAIEIGSERALVERHERGLARDLLSLGGLAVLALLPILFWFWRRSDRASLWLGLYVLTSALFVGISGERVLQPLLAPLGWDGAWRIALLLLVGGLAAFPAFLNALYAGAFPRLAVRLVFGGCALYALVVLLTPARVFTQLGPLLVWGSALVAALCAGVLVRAALQRRAGAWALMAGLAVLVVCIVHDISQSAYQLAGKLTPYGMFLFALAPAVLLARRFARALRAEELHAVEQKQRASLLVHATQAGLLDWDAVADRTAYSDRLKEILGYPGDADTAKWQFFEFVHPEDRERVRASFLAQLRDRSTRAGVRVSHDPADYRLRRADGSYVWIHAEALSVTGEDGRMLRYVCSFIDITERKQQEIELSDRIKFTRDLVDSVPIALALRDPEGKFLLVNRKWEEYFGAKRDDVVGKPVQGRVRQALLELDRVALERGPGSMMQENDFEFRGRKFTQTRSVMADQQGRVFGVLVASLDTSERWAIQERLRGQVALTEAIVGQAPNAIFAKDREGRFTLVNRGWSEMSGVAAETALGHTVYDLYPAEAARRFAEEDEKLIAQGAGAPLMESMHRGPKPDQYRIVRKAVLSRGEEVLGLVCSSTDVSEIKKMERTLESEQRRLDLVVRAQQVGIVDWDGRTHATFYSPRFRQILGHAADADTSAWPDYFKVLIHPDDREHVTTRWRAFILGKSGEGHGSYYAPEEYRLLRADGSYVWVEVTGMAVRDARGFVVRWIASVTDVTEKREQRETLEQSVRLREEVDRISRHDLKTPLNSIIGIPRLLRDSGRLTPEDADLLAFVEQAGYRLLGMVNLSLDMFRMEQGSYPLSAKAVDVQDVLHKVARDLETLAASRGVAIEIDGPRVHARGEELLCYSMLANLAKNAVEASPEGSAVRVTVRGDEALVRVAIHNPGTVPESMRGRFFQKYATSGKSGGSGLGTYSARLIARTQDGDIEMQTSAAEGTTLTVRLPGSAAPTAVQEVTAAVPALPAPEPVPLSVLVVDDDEYTRLIVQRFLPAAMHCATASNGRDALAAVMADPPDAVVMDLDMPVMGGMEAASRIRQWERDQGQPRRALICMSSHDDLATRNRALAAGFDEYLEKPVSSEALRRALAAHAHPPGPDAPVRIDPDLRDALPGFLESRRGLAAELARLLESGGDAEEARKLAHKLAGSCALYGFRWAAGQGKMIENRIRGNALEGLAGEARALCRHLDEVRIGFAAERGSSHAMGGTA